MTDKTNATNQANEPFLSDKQPNVIDLPTTPLARVHSSQKHAYSSDRYDHSGAAQPYVDNQPASLAVEAAVAIVINGIHYAVLMASPNQLEYLAVGFLFSEGLIRHSHELLDWEVTLLTDISSYRQFAQDLDDESN
ncbi:MAG: formate dehydrogenase accessory sulfurtransferase FdhD, partial [Psychrobacter alimentarius]